MNNNFDGGNKRVNSPMQNLELANDEVESENVTQSSLKKRILQIIIDFICIIITFGAFIGVYYLLEPRVRGFHCTDTDIFNPYIDDTIEFWVVGLYATVAPVLFILFVELKNAKLIYCNCNKKRNKTSSRKKVFIVSTVHALSLFILGIGITLLLTEIGKRWVGRLRPHFITVCDPDFTKINCTFTGGPSTNTFYNYIKTNDPFCRNDAKNVKEARLSFPSGHSSYSCYTMLFLIIYLEARLRLLAFRFLKPLLQMTAFIAAYVTCLSRIGDYHHRGSDVIGGIVLGCIIAVFMTFFVGRVLWEYNYVRPYHDFDLKTQKVDKTKL